MISANAVSVMTRAVPALATCPIALAENDRAQEGTMELAVKDKTGRVNLTTTWKELHIPQSTGQYSSVMLF